MVPKRALWSEEDLVTAVRAVKRGTLSTYAATERNKIPKRTIRNNLKSGSKAWLKAFMKRNPVVSKRKAQFMNPARAQDLNIFIVADHFAKMSEIYDDLDLKIHPERIYSMDEKEKGKSVNLQSSEHAEIVTIVGCVNALGTAIPSIVIFKGKRLKPELNDNLPVLPFSLR
ncbi:hypothetical protein PR048_013901 [Dryococelus australis]|uniref:HTH psq-type domain-containing protein n=1 Tax=Dryococelus australis TaxID=614101 RepID=A0ABQ9HTH0_9NEOP|nr:hypothetical protein PR048_013901 [Dryococelus australis]